MYDTVAGIGLDEARPGYKHIVFAPQPGGGLTHARAKLDSPYGAIESSWKLEGETLIYDVTIPPNTTAGVRLPSRSIEQIRESGRELAKVEGIKVEGFKDGITTLTLPAGKYHFQSTY
jgi:alpha-L-rhamnosidase